MTRFLFACLSLSLLSACNEPPDEVAGFSGTDVEARLERAVGNSPEIVVGPDASTAEKFVAASDVLGATAAGLEIQLHVTRSQAASGLIDISEAELQAIERAMDRILVEHGDAIADEYAQMFAEVYTEEEMQAAIAFYTTPEGASFLRKMPTAASKGAEIGERIIGPRLGALVIEERRRRTP